MIDFLLGVNCLLSPSLTLGVVDAEATDFLVGEVSECMSEADLLKIFLGLVIDCFDCVPDDFRCYLDSNVDLGVLATD